MISSIFLFHFRDYFNKKLAILIFTFGFGFLVYTSLDRRGFQVNSGDLIKPPHPLTMYLSQIDFEPVKAKAIYKGKQTFAQVLKPKFNGFCSTIDAICSPNADDIILIYDDNQRLKEVLNYDIAKYYIQNNKSLK